MFTASILSPNITPSPAAAHILVPSAMWPFIGMHAAALLFFTGWFIRERLRTPAGPDRDASRTSRRMYAAIFL